MPAFSFTAPFVSPEQEAEEFATFSDEAKEQIIRDLHGEAFIVDPPNLDEALSLLGQAIDTMPDSEKATYLFVLEKFPHLVQQESPGERFLRAADFDPWAAASRLVQYWTMRRKFFGDDRAFLPMTLKGAMREDRKVLELGFCAHLPPDKSGRFVVYWNRIACTSAVASRESFLRCLFYMTHVASENENAQRGLVLLFNARGYDLYRHFDRYIMKGVCTFPSCLAINFRSTHIITGSGNSVVSLMVPVLKHLMGMHQRHRLKLHAGSDLEVVDSLGNYGIMPNSIPSTFGGEWRMERFMEWIRQRETIESRRC